MKTFIKRIWVLGVMALMVSSLLSPLQAQANPGGRVSFQVFYDELTPYGRWIQDPDYGYVWSPRVERDFQPYASRGHWVMTEYGNTWVSDYDWGWAPFHYGRWMYDDYYGWLWVPGQEWGPAWVDWRHTDGYYGWAPMGPRVTYVVAPVRWIFVPVMYITSPRIYSYCVPRTQVVNIYHRTTVINNYYERDNRRYVYGPRANDIERYTHRKVQVHRVNQDNRPGRTMVADNSVRIYRPDIDSRRREAPSSVEPRSAAPRTRLSDNQPTSARTDRSTSVDRTRTPSADGGHQQMERTSPARTRTRDQVTSSDATTGQTNGHVRGQETSPATEGRPSYPDRTRRPQSSERTAAEPGYSGPRTRAAQIEQAPQRSSDPIMNRSSTSGPSRSQSSSQGQYQPRSRETSAPVSPQSQPSRSSGETSPNRPSARGRN